MHTFCYPYQSLSSRVLRTQKRPPQSAHEEPTSTGSVVTKTNGSLAVPFVGVVCSSVFRKSRRGGGQGLGGRYFTQGGRLTVVIGETFRRDFSSLEDALRRCPTTFFPVNTFAIGGRRTVARAPSAPKGGGWPSGPLPTAYVPVVQHL